jgi:hypothetical protein
LSNDYVALTFATSGKSLKHKDYSSQLARLQLNLAEFGIPLTVYDENTLRPKLDRYLKSFFWLRKGAGYWFWKPLAILDFLNSVQNSYIIYVDVDFEFRRDPKPFLDNALGKSDLCGFRQNIRLRNFTSNKCMDLIGVPRDSEADMWTASLIGIKRTSDSMESLRVWRNYVVQPRFLMDPVFSRGKLHRHDQSILSCMVETRMMKIIDLGDGLWSPGLESRASSLEESWVYTGGATNNEISQPLHRFRQFRSKIFHKIQLMIFKLLFTPIFRTFSRESATY